MSECDIPCDDDCDAPCHAGHYVTWKKPHPDGSCATRRSHHPDCPARFFADKPERCRCIFLSVLDGRPAS